MFNFIKHLDQQGTTRLRDVTNFLYRCAGIGIGMVFIAITVLTFLVATEIPIDEKVTLWAIVIGVLLLRITDVCYWFLYLRGSDFNPRPVFLRFSLGLAVTALTWCLYCFILFSKFDLVTISATSMIACAITSAAISSLSSNKYLCMMYSTIIVFPLSVMALSSERTEIAILGALGFCYWLAILLIAHKTSDIIANTIRLKHSNSLLVDELQTEKEEISRINDELSRSNEALDHANASLELEVNKRTSDIHRLSNRDPLTGLMNRKGFLRLINKQINASQQMNHRFALLFIDLDGFKQINDSLGHQIGDGVLEEIAERLTRYSDIENLGRWGGDEFVMLVPYANGDTAIAVAHATRSSIALPMEVMSNQVSLNATIGIALFPDHATEAQELIQLADLTMYDQKKTKPGSFGLFNETLYTKLQQDITYRDGLRKAIVNNELALVYQPLVNAEDYSVWGFEALLRWTFKGKPVYPDNFIPLAEKTGLIIDIGMWVLHRACIDAEQWSTKNHTVSVNVSVIQLMDDNFVSTLDNVIQSSGIDPSRLHLEITESVFADNKKKIRAQIEAIKLRKVQISIDDFGTGFSSLSQLQSLSFDHIKIDRAFVQGLEEGSDTIIRATLLIAKEFNCITVAEGIESLADAKKLKSMGVNILQGYYFSKPIANSLLSEWIEKHQEKY